jgi:hypothetical protein
MFEALRRLSGRLGLQVRQLEELDVRAILDLVRDYNRSAKKTGVPQIAEPSGSIDVGAIYRRLKLSELREARGRNRSQIERFQREIRDHIDRGVPLLWSVQLGLVQEPGIPQNAGGHMRLIIGYNSKTQELLFSDSWGPGHERKRMALNDAWAITTGLAVLEPLR